MTHDTPMRSVDRCRLPGLSCGIASAQAATAGTMDGHLASLDESGKVALARVLAVALEEAPDAEQGTSQGTCGCGCLVPVTCISAVSASLG